MVFEIVKFLLKEIRRVEPYPDELPPGLLTEAAFGVSGFTEETGRSEAAQA